MIKIRKFNTDVDWYLKDKIKYATTCKIHYTNSILISHKILYLKNKFQRISRSKHFKQWLIVPKCFSQNLLYWFMFTTGSMCLYPPRSCPQWLLYQKKISFHLIMKTWRHDEIPKFPFKISNLLGPSQPILRIN